MYVPNKYTINYYICIDNNVIKKLYLPIKYVRHWMLSELESE